MARKVILTAILGSTASVFIATRILQAGNFVWFCMFYAGFPAMITGSQKNNIAPVSIFLIINLSRIGRKNQINLKLLYSLQYMSYFASIIILSLACTSIINSENLRPLQINALPENESTFFIRVNLG